MAGTLNSTDLDRPYVQIGQAHFPRKRNSPKILIQTADLKNQINSQQRSFFIGSDLRLPSPNIRRPFLSTKRAVTCLKDVQLVATTFVTLFRKKSITNSRKKIIVKPRKTQYIFLWRLSLSLTYCGSRSTSSQSSTVCHDPRSCFPLGQHRCWRCKATPTTSPNGLSPQTLA